MVAVSEFGFACVFIVVLSFGFIDNFAFFASFFNFDDNPFNCFFRKKLHLIPFSALAVLDRNDDIRHAFRTDDVFVREAVLKRHWDNEIDGQEIGLTEIRVMSKPTQIKTLLLIWDALVISAHKCPMSEIDVRVIETSPFLGCLEMRFELFKYILVQEGPQKILLINRINTR